MSGLRLWHGIVGFSVRPLLIRLCAFPPRLPWGCSWLEHVPHAPCSLWLIPTRGGGFHFHGCALTSVGAGKGAVVLCGKGCADETCVGRAGESACALGPCKPTGSSSRGRCAQRSVCCSRVCDCVCTAATFVTGKNGKQWKRE